MDIGDRVVTKNISEPDHICYNGMKGTIISINSESDWPYQVETDCGKYGFFAESELAIEVSA
ncbi:hypothetical protein ABEF85_05080 [Acinetobacter thermotolerans]|uniref:hypothetical protein n=1 Tax=Acinetobacter thermotolerans TaxID=3151487 RepID=UPI00325AE6FC